MAALDLTLALGRADGAAVTGLLDAVGYQALPLSGELPENPDKPTPRADVRQLVEARPVAALGDLPFAGFRVMKRSALSALFPAAAQWMLPTDWAVVIEPAPGVAEWVQQRCCVVVRVRARKPHILGGNLLECLPSR